MKLVFILFIAVCGPGLAVQIIASQRIVSSKQAASNKAEEAEEAEGAASSEKWNVSKINWALDYDDNNTTNTTTTTDNDNKLWHFSSTSAFDPINSTTTKVTNQKTSVSISENNDKNEEHLYHHHPNDNQHHHHHHHHDQDHEENGNLGNSNRNDRAVQIEDAIQNFSHSYSINLIESIGAVYSAPSTIKDLIEMMLLFVIAIITLIIVIVLIVRLGRPNYADHTIPVAAYVAKRLGVKGGGAENQRLDDDNDDGDDDDEEEEDNEDDNNLHHHHNYHDDNQREFVRIVLEPKRGSRSSDKVNPGAHGNKQAIAQQFELVSVNNPQSRLLFDPTQPPQTPKSSSSTSGSVRRLQLKQKLSLLEEQYRATMAAYAANEQLAKAFYADLRRKYRNELLNDKDDNDDLD